MDYQELLQDTQLLYQDLDKTLADKKHNMVRAFCVAAGSALALQG